VLDGTSGRHASLLAQGGPHGVDAASAATLQMRETSLAGQKVNYLDSGYSEEGDASAANGDHQVTSCLMQTASGSIYIPAGEARSRAKAVGEDDSFVIPARGG